MANETDGAYLIKTWQSCTGSAKKESLLGSLWQNKSFNDYSSFGKSFSGVFKVRASGHLCVYPKNHFQAQKIDFYKAIEEKMQIQCSASEPVRRVPMLKYEPR